MTAGMKQLRAPAWKIPAAKAPPAATRPRARSRILGLCLTLCLCLPAAAALSQEEEESKPARSLRSSCITVSQIQRSEVLDDSTILFHMRNGRIKKATLAFGCPSLKFYDSFSYRVYSNRLCARTDVIVSRGGAHCPIADISDYEPPAKAEGKDRD